MFTIYKNWNYKIELSKLYTRYFTVKKTKKWFKITYLNWFNNYVYINNINEFNKLYRISNYYCIDQCKEDIIDYIKNNS
jgi:hypothetical protein